MTPSETGAPPAPTAETAAAWALTLIQTRRMQPIPVVLFGRDYWRRIVDWELFVEEGTISPQDLDLIHYAETAQECWKVIQDFYREVPAEKLPRGQ